MIKSFKNKGLEDFFYDGSLKGINKNHADKIAIRLDFLDEMIDLADLNQFPNWDPHPLIGKNKGEIAIKVSGAWRITFKFDEGKQEVSKVDYLNYH